jgi:hypothetical protein
MNDYIPERDAEFKAWMGQLAHHLTEPGAPGVPADLRTAVQAAATAFEADFQAHIAAQAAASAARQVKETSRRQADLLARQVARIVQADPAVTDPQRKALGLPVRDRTRTPVAAPQTAPQVIVDASERLRHLVRFLDKGPPVRRARPRGTIGCEVWMRIESQANADNPAPVTSDNGAVGNGPDGMHLVRLATASPLLVEFRAEQAGRMAHYQLRWVNRRGQTGPWSEAVRATIPG